MSALAISVAAFACVFGGALLGFRLRAVLPEGHLSPASRDLMKLGIGMIATMMALVLGLLVASAKTSYDTESRGVTELSAKVILLDRVLAHYGPETQEARALLKVVITRLIEITWSNSPPPPGSQPPGSGAELVYDKIEHLLPQNEAQRELQNRALSIAFDLAGTRLLMVQEAHSPISVPLLAVVIFSLTITFISFGLHAAPNGTILATFFLSALAVAAVIFLILEMYSPFSGLLPIPSAPLRSALERLGQ